MPESVVRTWGCHAFGGDEEAALRNLVDGQLVPAGVRDERVLQAMGSLPRTCFVPAHLAGAAYRDGPFPVSPGRYLMDPLQLARLVQALEIKSGDSVLDLAPATGYSTALLASLASRVIVLEAETFLADRLNENVTTLQMQNIQMADKIEASGWDVLKACRAVLINGSVEQMPQALLDAIVDETRIATFVSVALPGGRDPFPLSEARLYRKDAGKVSYRVLFEAQAPRLALFNKPKAFVF